MSTTCCGNSYFNDAIPSSAQPASAPSSAETAGMESLALVLFCIAFIVFFYGSVFFVFMAVCLRQLKKPNGDEEVGVFEPLPEAVRHRKRSGVGEKRGIRIEECMICLEDFEEMQIVRVLPRCKHAFHVRCIDSWFVCKPACPICRQ